MVLDTVLDMVSWLSLWSWILGLAIQSVDDGFGVD